VLSVDGVSPSQHGSTVLSLLPQADEWVLLVPTQALSWHRLTLPKAPPKRMRAALEGVLEEQLLDEPGALHLALEPGARPGTPAWVAVCDLAWLKQCLQLLDAVPHPLLRLVPEHAPATSPLAEPQFYLDGQPEQAWLTRVDAEGVLRLPWSAQLPAPSQAVCAEPAVAELAEQWLQRKVDLVHPAQRAAHSARSEWDLAQFGLLDTQGARRARRWWGRVRKLLYEPRWRAWRWGTVCLLGVNLIGLNALAWTESRAAAAQQAALNGLLTRSFPAVKVVLDAPLQMQREVDKLQAGSGALRPNDLEAMLVRLGPLLAPGNAPTGLRYSRDELSLLGLNPGFAAPLQAPLKALGYASRMDGQRLVLRAEAAP